MRLGNTVDFPLAYLGALAAGLVPVPTAAALTAREVAPMIAALDPALILHDADCALPAASADPAASGACARMRELPPADWHMGDPERPGYIIYTSGTVGHAPRGRACAPRDLGAADDVSRAGTGCAPMTDCCTRGRSTGPTRWAPA